MAKKIPVSELEGPLLAEFVARANPKFTVEKYKHGIKIREDGNVVYLIGFDAGFPAEYRPDINGGQAMELVLPFGVCIDPINSEVSVVCHSKDGNPYWKAFAFERDSQKALWIAICRAVVASHFGGYVVVNNCRSCGTMEIEE